MTVPPWRYPYRAAPWLTRWACLAAVVGCSDLPSPGLDQGTEAIVISNLAVQHNPNSTISCFVTWTTNLPAVSWVEFGESKNHAFRTQDGPPATDHFLLIIGMQARKTYHLRALSRSVDNLRSTSADATYTTGALPASVEVGKVIRHDPDRAQPGWTLMNLSNYVKASPAVAVMVDMSGQPVWYHISSWPGDSHGDVDVSLVNNSKAVLVGGTGATILAEEVDLSGKVLWTGPPILQPSSGQIHHHFAKLDNGNYVTLRRWRQGDTSGDIIDEFDAAHVSSWSWNVFEHLKPSPGATDWTHGNSVTVHLNKGVVYYSARNLSALFKIRRSDGHIIWRLGAGGDFKGDPQAKVPWFYKQHDPEVLPNGNVLFYDNGNDRLWSRAVEYQLDEKAMTARIVWQYPGDNVAQTWYTQLWGDADRLANGNTLITAGTRAVKGQSRIFEVTRDGNLVWELLLPSDTKTTVGVYRSERIPALVQPTGR